MHSLVPGGQPVELVASYPEFAGYYPTCEMQTKRWLARRVQPDWVAIDIGANVGIHAILVARLASRGHVHAFEPTATANMLRANLLHAGAANVTVHEVAVGERAGVREEPIHRIWGAEPETRAYPFTTIDDFVRDAGLRRLDLVKTDTDGYDLDVLRGARETLERFDPWVVVELGNALATRGHLPSEALAWLASVGYREALVLDGENFVLRRIGSSACPGADVALRFDRDPVVIGPAVRAGEELHGLVDDEPVLHNATEPADGRAGAIAVPGPRWSFGAAWPFDGAAPGGPVLVEVEARVSRGVVGLGCLTGDLATYSGEEVFIGRGRGSRPARIVADGRHEAAWLMARNASPGNETAVVEIGRIRVFRAVAEDRPEPDALRADVRDFDLDALLADGAPNPGRRIPIVPVNELAAALGFSRPFVPGRLLHVDGLPGLDNDAELERYLLRESATERVLDFGGGDGFGAPECAESCDATVWAVGLADRDGRETGGGAAAGGAGRSGREASFGGRIHPVPRDSRDLAPQDFAGLEFDSILIDGGHAPDVVASDTDLALSLARPGAMVIWHDFCPDPDALAASEAGRGVVRAWQEHHDRWRPRLSSLFWIRPSWLLVGVVA